MLEAHAVLSPRCGLGSAAGSILAAGPLSIASLRVFQREVKGKSPYGRTRALENSPIGQQAKESQVRHLKATILQGAARVSRSWARPLSPTRCGVRSTFKPRCNRLLVVGGPLVRAALPREHLWCASVGPWPEEPGGSGRHLIKHSLVASWQAAGATVSPKRRLACRPATFPPHGGPKPCWADPPT